MPTGSEIMTRAGILLNDEDHVRWTLPELAGWINEAVRAVVLAKPSASTQTSILSLVAGTRQTVPSTGTPTPLMLIGLVRNIKSAGPPREGGRIITTVAMTQLDADEPNWHLRNYVPYRKDVRHLIYDEAMPLEFYVYPGNDGNGLVEAIISTLPQPLAASGADDAIGSYNGSVGLPEPYSGPLLDYVMSRAHSKDDLAAEGSRAAMYFQQFASAVGLKIQTERATSPNARRGA